MGDLVLRDIPEIDASDSCFSGSDPAWGIRFDLLPLRYSDRVSESRALGAFGADLAMIFPSVGRSVTSFAFGDFAEICQTTSWSGSVADLALHRHSACQ